MTVPLRVHAATHVGLVHDINEDSWAVTPTEEGGLLLLVCDGMGGMGRGDEASSMAIAAIREWMEAGSGLPPERLRQAIRSADRQVRDALCDGGDGHPGSTAVMAYVIDGAAHVAWVGDSRAYLLRDHRVVDRTRDHKLVEELVAAGRLTPEEARASDFAHVVTRALGGRAASEPDVRPANLAHPWKLAHGDVLLICSDGISDLIDDEELPGLLAERPPDQATERLIEVALERGGHDNITCIVARWEGSTYREDEVATPVMRPERQYLPDLRVPEGDVDRDEEPRVTEEIDRDELDRIVGATPTGAPTATTPAPAAVTRDAFPDADRTTDEIVTPPRPRRTDGPDAVPPPPEAERVPPRSTEAPPPSSGDPTPPPPDREAPTPAPTNREAHAPPMPVWWPWAAAALMALLAAALLAWWQVG